MTVEPGTKPEPRTVKKKFPVPWAAVAGVDAVKTGTGVAALLEVRSSVGLCSSTT